MSVGEYDDQEADVVVVGAGPAGSAAAYHLARAGLDVALVEKHTFPRPKVCGDGLTPRAVRELVDMGVDLSPEAGWHRNRGLRVHGGGHHLQLPWPAGASYPDFGLARPRAELDELLARHAQRAGARLTEATAVVGPLLHERTGRTIGVRARTTRPDGTRADRLWRAPVVVAADGASARLATRSGIQRLEDRPLGVAVRAYFRSPRAEEPWMESHLELWDGEPGESNLLPGYGWVFPLGDGTVNVGLGSVRSHAGGGARRGAAGNRARPAQGGEADLRDLLRRWLAALPPEWGLTPENRIDRPASAALPMAFNRKPLYRTGLLLVGDAGGMVSPFNGEGIAYALQSGRLAAQAVAQAHARTSTAARVRALRSYPQVMAAELGGYFTLGRIFVSLIEHPEVMRLCTRYGLGRPTLMRFVMKLLADMYEPRGGDTMDRVIAALARCVPEA